MRFDSSKPPHNIIIPILQWQTYIGIIMSFCVPRSTYIHEKYYPLEIEYFERYAAHMAHLHATPDGHPPSTASSSSEQPSSATTTVPPGSQVSDL
jgi:hypothetical protein